MFNKKASFIFIALVIILLFATTISAKDDTTNTIIDHDTKIIDYNNNLDADINVDTKEDVKTKTIDNDNNLKTYTENKKTTKSPKKNTNTTSVVTNMNYNKYFSSSDGKILNTIDENSTVILSGEFTNKIFKITTKNLYITGDNTTQIRNGRIILDTGSNGTTVVNIKINNTNPSDTINDAIEVVDSNITIANNTIYMEKISGITCAIRNYGDNNKIINNNATVSGPCSNINWASGSTIADTITIAIQYGSNITIENNNVAVLQTKNSASDPYGTVNAIMVSGENIKVANNNITANISRLVYAIDTKSATNITIINNKINLTSQRYTAAIQVGDDSRNAYVANNEIYSYCYNTTPQTTYDEAISYGIIASNMGGTFCENVVINNNTIVLNSRVAYAIEAYSTKYINITNNKLNATGAYAMGIGLSDNIINRIDGNIIHTTGNSSIAINQAYEAIDPVNTAIHIQLGCHFTNITNNKINTTDANNKSLGINSSASNDVIIKNNKVDTNTKTGSNAIVYTGSDVVVENNTSSITGKNKVEIKIILPDNSVTSTTIKIKAEVLDANTKAKINSGSIIFKINGNTIKLNGKSSHAIKDGVAEVNYTLNGLTSKNYTITAIYSGSEMYDEDENTTTLSVLKTNITPTSKTLNSYSGSEVQVNETLYDISQKQLLGRNKIAVKLNGKTIYNGVIEDGKLNLKLKLPDEIRAGSNNLTIIIGTSSRYNKIILNYNLSIAKQDAVIVFEPVKTYNEVYTTLKATIRTSHTNKTVNSGKFTFKVNGKTIPNMNSDATLNLTTLSVKGGICEIHTFFPFTMTSKEYDIMVIFSGNSFIAPRSETFKASLKIL
ncbi:MAG: hypothetical protein SOZ23_02280 [Methanosphaera sp.]|uniref:hypothetical protein n=1 Tax=Methanosphaera sp. TaxID=2666342 RepID=UPI0025DCE8C0|nr:hypothetical protein [Methanosphaera sp.]MCI5867205.1 hypothetical protein [Methanosphaera sp.]MDD6534727.1 hypothetical protein [Methanosphaera sp.]MDY3955605.1 hypothetical protein [Methanosphaera sp.]